MIHPAQKNIVDRLQREILSLQGFSPAVPGQGVDFGLGMMEAAFAGQSFPVGVHEFISAAPQDAAATTGFMSCLLGRLMGDTGVCIWISTRRTLFPPALAAFGIAPHRVIFIDLANEKDALWAMEEALKCDALACVAGEISELSFTASRRLQLVVEKSRVTGLLHRSNPRRVNILACVTRWQITPISSELADGMPGVGLARWQVELQKVRGGQPGSWHVQWSAAGFEISARPAALMAGIQLLKTG